MEQKYLFLTASEDALESANPVETGCSRRQSCIIPQDSQFQATMMTLKLVF